MSEWFWEPDDFAGLWFNDGRDRFPRPLHFASRFRYREEFDAHGRSVRTGYSKEESNAIELVLHTLATADLRIEASGETGADGPTTRTYRILGVRSRGSAVIAAQTAVNGVEGPIWVRRGRPENLGNGIANCIPNCSPGRQSAKEFYTRDLEPDFGTYFTDVARSSPHERYQRFISRPLTGSGSAAVRAGDHHHQSAPIHIIEWLDYADDGRYLQRRNSERIEIEPGDCSHLAEQMTKLIDNELRRRIEHRDS
ncbi:ESX secretion-associated protein EspG [Nocardia sp. NPDC058480]|uniref:ESX secretion-associated protein EspG n=1 Tax=unclassified Nocardia TaxID=2637762 RepID=UPI00365AA4EB